MNRDNQPTYNANRNIANFGDFNANIDAEKEELEKIKRATTPNSERQQHLGNKNLKFNKVTRKLDDLSPDEVNDNIDAIEDLKERVDFPIGLRGDIQQLSTRNDEIGTLAKALLYLENWSDNGAGARW